MSEVWGLIPARLDSSRLHGKALLKLHGLPMIVHVAKRAALAKSLDHVVVCTDSDRIASICTEYSIDVCLTSCDCRNGTERIFEAAKSMRCKSNDLIIDIQGDEPLIDPFSIDSVVAMTREKRVQYDVFLPHLNVCPVGNHNVVKVISSGDTVIYLSRSDAPYAFSKEAVLKKHLSVIGFTFEALEFFCNSPEGELERVEGVELLRALESGLRIYTFPVLGDSFSVDVKEDFDRAEKALEHCPLFKAHYAGT